MTSLEPTNQGHDLESWPNILQELASIIGPEATLRLARSCGGVERIYIPRSASPSHPWAQVLTPEQWARVVALWGGYRIDLPQGTYANNMKKRRIIDMLAAGVAHREIARVLRCSERHVRRVRRDAGFPLPPTQHRSGDSASQHATERKGR